MNPVTLQRRGAIALVTIDNPPVNATGRAVRAGLVEAARTVAADPEIRGAVLLCAGRTFVAGADIAEFDRPPEAPTLRDSYAALEELAKPVVALLHGTALGGGLELALSCHYRVIDPAGSVGLPEVSLGIIPGAGGTQRLPRLIGLDAALDMITSGRRVAAAEALRFGVVDAVTDGDRIEFAVSFLTERLVAEIPRVSLRPFPAVDPTALAAAQAAVARKAPGQVAPLAAVDVLADSAGLDFPAGEIIEQAAFEALRTSPQSAALRHVFFAERAAAKVPGLGSPWPVRTVGVVGGGTMGAGIAAASLLAGYAVRLVEGDEAALPAARERVEVILRGAVTRGKLAPEAVDAEGDGRLRLGVDLDLLGEADLVVEAVPEDAALKYDVFLALDRIAKPGAVLATNTSYLDVAALASATTRPANVIGLHFFSPAHANKLLEVVVPDGASPDAAATGFAFGKALGKLAVWAGNREGFIGNRVLSAYRSACDVMVEDGASPWEVDAAFQVFGFPMGVFAMQDMAGLDIGWATRKRLAPARDPARRSVAISDRLCERGWFGRKTGRGYYLYGDNGPVPNPDLDAIVAAERRAKAIVPRSFDAGTIMDRVLLAAVNAGVSLLGEGVALRAGDIDVVMVNGFGFPRFRGGPMHAAEARGLERVVSELEDLARDDAVWRPAPLLQKAARAGGFNKVDR